MLNLLVSQRIYVDQYGQLLDALEKKYTIFFNSLKINIYPVSNFIEDISNYLKELPYHGLILSGGGDPNPQKTTLPNTSLNYYPQRDQVENDLIRLMISEKKSIMGICYGMQQLNCHFGGKVTPNLLKHDSDDPIKSHKIRIQKKLFDLADEYYVNHFHNHGIEPQHLADDFDAWAIDSDSHNIEGIIHKSLPIMGILWHPERESPDRAFNEKLIRRFFNIS